ncbi:zinc-finger domain-containing protein [Niallia nealsonii]|uniref:Zinc-finger domain-containing protein n=1 Tax=Niallia nealsonii TaxID=115979 RepID=A0A2N0Z3I5_9BACI|nr:zinc-finger domain-containing protein [Niallia nealsonii]PKG24065.1 zinc-finger domain-containing protein [Niallia nealsonii]
MERKKWMQEVEILMNDFCKDCFLYGHHKNEKGKRYAHRFCISQCTVGEKIKAYGEKMMGEK